MKEELARLDAFGIVIWNDSETNERSITSDFRKGDEYTTEFDAAITGLETFVLAAHMADMDINGPRFLEALETAFERISDAYPDAF